MTRGDLVLLALPVAWWLFIRWQVRMRARLTEAFQQIADTCTGDLPDPAAREQITVSPCPEQKVVVCSKCGVIPSYADVDTDTDWHVYAHQTGLAGVS